MHTVFHRPTRRATVLRGEVQRLRAEVAELRTCLAAEIRTRRLVVVDERGIERIITSVTPQLADLTVYSAGDGGDEAWVAMRASATSAGVSQFSPRLTPLAAEYEATMARLRSTIDDVDGLTSARKVPK